MAFTMFDTSTLNNYHSAVQTVCAEVNQRFALQKSIPNKPMLKQMLRRAGVQDDMMDEAITQVLERTGKTIEQ